MQPPPQHAPGFGQAPPQQGFAQPSPPPQAFAPQGPAQFGAPAATPPQVASGGGGGKGPFIAIVGVLLAGLLGVGAYLGFSGDDDDETATVATTIAVQEPVEQETTTTTEAEEVAAPQSREDVSKGVVQIFPAVSGVPVCQGSGTIVSNDGLILTNAHVVENFGPCAYEELQIAITESTSSAPVVTYLAEVYAFDAALDLAVVGIATDLEGNPVTVDSLGAVPIGNSDEVGLGDSIEILGYPSIGGETITFTSGSVSGFTSEAGIADRAFIKTDTVISGGNSGGLAMNVDFELIGVPTQASGGAGLEVADCRIVTDTNGDGLVNDLDSCIPIGGFLNGIRPVNLALGLIESAAARQPVEAGAPAPVTSGEVLGFFYDLNMTSAIAADRPVDTVVSLGSGVAEVCASFAFEDMQEGLVWDALWSIDGEFVEEISIVESEWFGPANGDDWWVCATGDEGGLADGVYELQLFIQGEFTNSNTVHIGDQYAPTEVTIVNDTANEICYLRVSPMAAGYWGPDELEATQTMLPGESVTITAPEGAHDVLGQDCEGTTLVELYGFDFVGPSTVNLSGN